MLVQKPPLYWLGAITRLWATTLFLLSTTDVESALVISFLTPVATTVWTTGQDATISWNCSGPYSAAFSIILYTGPQNQPVPGLAPLGQISCSSSLTIKVPSTIPSGRSYYVGAPFNPGVLASVHFTIINPATTSRTSTDTIPTTTGTSTTVVPTTIATSSSTPESNDNIGPLNGDSIGNGAAITGGIAGAIIAALVVLLAIRKHRQRKKQPINVKGSGDIPLSGNVLPFNKKTSDRGEFGRYLQTSPGNNSPLTYTQVPTVIDSQNTSGSPHSWPGTIHDSKVSPCPVSYSSYPLIPSGTVSTSNPQHSGQEIKQQLAFQEQLFRQRSPQQISSNFPNQTLDSLRGPEEFGGTVLTKSNFDLQQQINFLHTELNQLQAKLDSAI